MFANLKLTLRLRKITAFFLFVQENNGFIYFLDVFCAIKVLIFYKMMLVKVRKFKVVL